MLPRNGSAVLRQKAGGVLVKRNRNNLGTVYFQIAAGFPLFPRRQIVHCDNRPPVEAGGEGGDSSGPSVLSRRPFGSFPAGPLRDCEIPLKPPQTKIIGVHFGNVSPHFKCLDLKTVIRISVFRGALLERVSPLKTSCWATRPCTQKVIINTGAPKNIGLRDRSLSTSSSKVFNSVLILSGKRLLL